MDSILLPKQIDLNNVTFSPIKVLDNGGRMVYINYLNKPFNVQTPEMSAPFGLSRFAVNDAGASNDKYSIEVSFKNMATKASEEAFFKVLRALDARVVAAALDNSAAWLKKKYNSLEVVEALYTPCVKFPKDKVTGEITDKYAPTFRMNVPFRDNAFACDVYNTEGERIDLGSVETKGGKVSAIMTCSAIWIAGGKFGVSWRIVQLRVQPSTVITKFAFRPMDDDDVVPAPAPAAAPAATRAIAAATVPAIEDDVLEEAAAAAPEDSEAAQDDGGAALESSQTEDDASSAAVAKGKGAKAATKGAKK